MALDKVETLVSIFECWHACGCDALADPLLVFVCAPCLAGECGVSLADHPGAALPIPTAPEGKVAEGTRAERGLDLDGGHRLRDGERQG